MPSEFTREDYEHAARAGGIKGSFAGGLWWSNACGMPWRPLDDDGDTLRLLCRCSMRIVESNGGTYRAVQFTLHESTDEQAEHEIEIEWPHTPAAHRVAAFRAAIEIGKSMKGTP